MQPEATTKTEEIPQASDDATIELLISRGEYQKALRGLARSYGPSIGRFCMALTGSQDESVDLTYRILEVAFDGLPSYRREAPVRSYVFGVARRICAEHCERKGRDGAQAGLDALKPTEREAVLLRHQAKLSFREIGLISSVDEQTAKARVSRALGRLAREMGTDG